MSPTRPASTWRDWYNPLRGLSMQRIVAMEDTAERGQFADLQWFWHHMERTDVTVQAAIARRRCVFRPSAFALWAACPATGCLAPA